MGPGSLVQARLAPAVLQDMSKPDPAGLAVRTAEVAHLQAPCMMFLHSHLTLGHHCQHHMRASTSLVVPGGSYLADEVHKFAHPDVPDAPREGRGGGCMQALASTRLVDIPCSAVALCPDWGT